MYSIPCYLYKQLEQNWILKLERVKALTLNKEDKDST